MILDLTPYTEDPDASRMNSSIVLMMIILLQSFGIFLITKVAEDLRRTKFNGNKESTSEISFVELQPTPSPEKNLFS